MRSDTERGNCKAETPHEPHTWSTASCPWCLGDLMFGATLQCQGTTSEHLIVELMKFLEDRIEESKHDERDFTRGGTIAFALTRDWLISKQGDPND